MVDKKGELTSGTIIGIVLVVAGFILILLFVPVIIEIFQGTESKELCRLSVITRATTPSVGQALIPLRCSTEKICISEDGRDDCRQFAGEEISKNVELRGSDEAKIRAIEKEIADEMHACWNMMGQGKLDLFGDLHQVTNFDIAEPKCVVCSRISVDRDLWNDAEFQESVAGEIDINDYLARNRPSENEGKTYLESFVGVGIGIPPKEVSSDNPGGGSDQLAVIFSQINTREEPWEAGVQTAGAGFLLYGSSIFTPAGRLTATPWGAAISGVGILGASGVSAYRTAQGQSVAVAHCGSFQTAAKDPRQGCSVVRAIEWSPEKVEEINGFCSGGIEGSL